MKTLLVLCSLVLLSCAKEEPRPQAQSGEQDEAQIEAMVTAMYKGLAEAYNQGGVDTDSLFEANYKKDVQYVTPWGYTEPLDSTKARLKKALPMVKDFAHRIESMRVKSWGNSAFAFFILRQNYKVGGGELDEYLPTTIVFERDGEGWKIVHVHRSTDYETIQQYVALQKRSAAKKGS